MPRILLIGFDVFGSVVDNPTARIAEWFQAHGVPGHELSVEVLPVSFQRAAARVEQRLVSEQFDYALLMGVAPNRRELSLEQQARNLADARIPDTDQQQPQSQLLDDALPETLETNLPLNAFTLMLQEAGFPTVISNDAGEYVCNSTYFAALGAIQKHQLSTRCLFLHVPPAPQTPPGEYGSPMPIERQIEAVSLLLRTLAG